MRIFDRYRRWAPSLGLRPVVGGVTAVLSLLAVTTCLALIFLTTTLRRETELSSSAARSVRLVETVR
ncbi:MAG TPA: hypothetical protein VE987_04670, partial [Polyangiaceae bacterium]|nr:hypothetical protein [Polyangiaceae bacterium]